jgi:hypothetical protein
MPVGTTVLFLRNEAYPGACVLGPCVRPAVLRLGPPQIHGVELGQSSIIQHALPKVVQSSARPLRANELFPSPHGERRCVVLRRGQDTWWGLTRGAAGR